MDKYIEVKFNKIGAEVLEILMGRLSETANGFEEEEQCLKAYFSSTLYDPEYIVALSKELGVEFQVAEIPEQNWNELWESNFEPVTVDDFVSIRADFHPRDSKVKHEIIINPKMSFGTGHHATTYLMVREMGFLDFQGKTVFDFGTGTGILAILAMKLGARSVVATDNNEWSIANAEENFQRNDVAGIRLVESDSPVQGKQFDIILANINRNILMDAVPALVSQLGMGGILLVSGLLESDEPDFVYICENNRLKLEKKSARNNWICLYMRKT
jgi:ribosomal protein L11 methyltransferase